MQEIEDYLVVISESGTAHGAVRQLSEKVRTLLKTDWVPFEGFSHVVVPDGMSGFIHIVTQPMLK